ncbi:MAG: MBL fold metallo-hydrolase [Pseudomonadota bacterium]|nr:MBL fold metallo-hydrolase [Pseudomonadales bacterium]MDY6918836.1 MBL fold metallo-hydrolase [Pseudomonadota bacterium]
MAKLTFWGAAREVTGSCHLIESEGVRLLLDCGMHQGGHQSERRNGEPFPFEPKQLDAVVLSHGHLDHSGLLPRLFKTGYKGPVYCTEATRNLLAIMLEDAAGIHLRDVEWENKRRKRAGKPEIEPWYDMEDVLHVLEHCVGLPYHETHTINGHVKLQFHDAGHIIGSAIVDLLIKEHGHSKKLVFSGDLGNADAVLMRDPEILENADLVLMEGTYGDRDHRTLDNTLDELSKALTQASADKGNVLIPAFAVGRTQEMLFHLGVLYKQGRVPQQRIFLDSPMGIEVTRLYTEYMDLLDPDDLKKVSAKLGDDPKSYLPMLTLTESTEDSMAINRIKDGAIIIAGSGMCNGGRIRHHLKHNIWREECHLVFPGFQAQGTLGRQIVEGNRHVKFFGQDFIVRAKVHTLGGFSAHAGQTQLLDWISHFKSRFRLYLVHGEPEALETLQQTLQHKLGINAEIPAEGTSVLF